MEPTTFVGLDVHKGTTSVAIAGPGRGGEVRFLGEIPSTPEALHRLVERLKARHRRLSFCYEAGPCGYGVHRLLSGLGQDCSVVAPSLIPSRPGDRVKTNRRDATALAKLYRAGELTPVWVPDTAHEAMRDLVRARATARRVLGKSRQHLQGFLLRHGRIYRGVRGWTKAYRRWLTTVRFDHPAQQIVLQDYIHAVEDAEARLERLEHQIEELLPAWSMAPVVEAVQAMRGVALIVAVTVVAEVGDFSRLRYSAPAHGLSGPDALGAVQRRLCPSWPHYQGRQRPCPPRPDRGRLDLPHAGEGQSQAARPARTSAPGGPRRRLEGSAPPVPPLPPPRGGRQAEGRHRTHLCQDAPGGRRGPGREPTDLAPASRPPGPQAPRCGP
jgi:transposase